MLPAVVIYTTDTPIVMMRLLVMLVLVVMMRHALLILPRGRGVAHTVNLPSRRGTDRVRFRLNRLGLTAPHDPLAVAVNGVI